MAISAVNTRHIHLLVTMLLASLSCAAQCGLRNDFTVRVAPAYNSFPPQHSGRVTRIQYSAASSRG